MDIQVLLAETRALEVKIGLHVLNVKYRPNVFTLKFAADLDKLQQDGDMSSVSAYMGSLLASWDLMNGTEPVPVTPEGISTVPLIVLTAIQEAVGSDMAPSSEEKKGLSEPTSTAPTDSTQPAQGFPNGSDTSSSPAPSESPSLT